ncbi:DUF305 domain-containing protein [Brevundimonas staleyi]|uniref:DUF305 domain-containing protein n=1 Tax=Brevundimonas staleyi TaxID=74326 RepID=A0ABW0FPN5_9CAUL|nr:DUF305 domain-containing protein [Brevundimonas diminuta]MDM8353514.1 DUF305 domain-containing protein [Brevundimonas diminuta]
MTPTHDVHSMKGMKGMKGSYRSLAIELTLDFIIMYLVMYTMIATLDHFYLNLNNVYMTLMMVSPMALLMLIFMRSMYPSRRTNLLIGGAAVLVFALSFYGMRTQAAVGDTEFLKSMIPHHSGAILMCREASLSDPEIVSLCDEIVAAQEREIAQMKAILARL